MKMECDVIRDLLPLYADDACSAKSRIMVEEHMAQCPACADLLNRIRQTEIDQDLKEEKEAVIRYGEKRFRRRSAFIGSVISGLFMIPILVCLIVNLASGRSLGWFFVVLASLAVAASLIIVPLMMPEDKGFWTFCAFCASLLLLLGVVCLYTGGKWFGIASSAVLFGLAVIFLPFVIRTRPVRKVIAASNPVLIVLCIDALLFVNMINMIRSYSKITWSSILFTLGVIAGIGAVIIEIIRKRES